MIYDDEIDLSKMWICNLKGNFRVDRLKGYCFVPDNKAKVDINGNIVYPIKYRGIGQYCVEQDLEEC